MKQTKFIPFIGLGLTLFLSKPHLIYASSGYGGGTGTETDPYLISTPEHLNQLQLDVNVNGVDTKGKYYRLTQNIDLSTYDNDGDSSNGNFTPIGRDYSVSFNGVFDGNGKVISNLEIILPSQDNVGLFGYTNLATIQNLGLKNILVEGSEKVGGLVGNQDGWSSQITQSYAIGNVIGNSRVGGLVGYQDDGVITQSYATGSVSGNYSVGGLSGSLCYGTITQSYATGDVSGDGVVGGLVGFNDGIITQSYAIGKVDGVEDVGGLVGILNYGEISESYWDTVTSGQNQTIGSGYTNNADAVGLTTSQMIGENGKTNMSSLDFDTIWKTTGSYPKFQWQPEETIEPTTNVKDLIVNGNVETMIADITIPSVSPDLVINPNLSEGSVSPEFSVSNDSVSPIRLELKLFEQTSNTFNDVLPSKYDSWVGLNKQQSQDIALGLIAKEGEGWQQLTTPTSYVANHQEHEIGIIKPTSTVDFSFDVRHGTSFSEAKTVQYKMVFVFDLMN